MKKQFMFIAVLSSIFFAVTDSYSVYYWAKHYAANEDDVAQCVKQVSNDEYVVAGVTAGLNYAGRTDIWILKLDSVGNITWQKTYGSGGFYDDYPTSIQLTTDGGYIVAGSAWFNAETFLETIWILKLDNSGEINWQKSYGGTGFSIDHPSSIQQTRDGGYIVAGYTTSFGVGIHNAWVLKLTDSGDVTWQKSYGGANNNFFHTIIQTDDGGYIAAGETDSFGAEEDYQFWIVKLDGNGNINWQKTYRQSGRGSISIQQTSDGGYVMVGDIRTNEVYGWEDIWILKIDGYGDVLWHKAIGGSKFDKTGVSDFFQETTDGGYVIAGTSDSFGSADFASWLVKLDSDGNISWQKTYGAHGASAVQQTLDGGYVMVGDNYQPDGGISAFWVLKLDGNGDIPDCGISVNTNATTEIPTIIVQDTTATVQETSAVIAATVITPRNTETEPSWVCCCNYEDLDCDGVHNDFEESLASSRSYTSFLTDEDNCSVTPNGPSLGTCTEGNSGNTCMANEGCGINGHCSMNQEDTYPPRGNGIGDACECEGNFNCDADTDSSDAATFKKDYGRSGMSNPCTNELPCKGDFECDTDVDSSDAALFKSDFGRSSMLNPCPACTAGVEWCQYE